MSTESSFKLRSKMSSDLDFIQTGEPVYSGPLGPGDTTNRPLSQLAQNTDALLQVVQTLLVSNLVTGGGVITWNGSQLAWSSDLVIPMLNEIDGTDANVLAASSSPITLAAGEVAYVTLDRLVDDSPRTPSVAASLAALLGVITANINRLDVFPIARREGADVILWDGRRLRSGQSLSNGGYTDTQYGQQSELTTTHSNQKENLKLLLTGGGTLSWDLGTTTFAWSDDLVVEFPSSVGNNSITTDDAVIAAGQVAYITLTRTPGTAVAKTLTVVADGSVPTGDDVFVVAFHNADDGRLYLWDGTALSDGDEILLGGLRSGIQWLYHNPGGATQVTDLTESGTYPSRTYAVGSGELMVYRNGVKAKRSLAYWNGTYPAGSLIGSLNIDDQYVEEKNGPGNTGNRIIWLADGQAVAEPLYHAAASHTPVFFWPTASDHLEAFVGLHGEGPSPVESVAVIDGAGAPIVGTAVDGFVRLKMGTNITLSYDVPNNAIVIAASITAGVASLNAMTGALAIVAGDGIMVTTGAGIITITGVNNFVDLADISIDEAAAVNGMLAPTASNVVMTASDVPYVWGFDRLWTQGPTEVQTSGGALRLGTNRWNHFGTEGAALSVTTATLFGSETLLNNTWYAIYVGPGAGASGTAPQLKISRYFPSPTVAYGRHPTDQNYAYLGCVYVDNTGNFIPFSKVDGWTYLGAGFDVTANFSGLPSSVGVSVNLTNATGLKLVSLVNPIMVRLDIELDSAAAGEMQSITVYHNKRVLTGVTHKAVSATGGASFFSNIDVPLDRDGNATFLFSNAVFNGVTRVVATAFHDGRYSLSTDLSL